VPCTHWVRYPFGEAPNDRLSKSTPSADVGRTRRIEFELVRKRVVEEAPRKAVGWRAREWRRMLKEGVYASQSDLARGEGVSTAAVSQALRKLREQGKWGA
jgi:hypothetical protein